MTTLAKLCRVPLTLVAFLCVVGGSLAQAQFQFPRVVSDIWPGPDPSTPHALAAMGDTLFFVAEDNPVAGGMQLWKTDGTHNGTLSVYQFPFGTHITEARAWNGALYFVAYNPVSQMSELWRSDGTFQGTARIVGPIVAFLGSPWRFTPSGKYLYFTADNPSSPTNLPELWRTDGTPEGTRPVVDIFHPDFFLSPSTLVDFSGVLLFVASDPFVGPELWRTDGTEQGTSLVRDIRQGIFGSDITELVVLGERVFFAADDGFNGKELWSTDGTEQGTQMWQPEIQFGPGSSSPTGLTAIRGELFFAADDGGFLGRELWKLDPSTMVLDWVDDINPGGSSNPTQLRDLEGRLFFVADGGQFGAEPYFLDGTPFFTFARLMDIAPGPQSSSPEALTNLNGSLLFRADNGFEGAEPWSTLNGPQSPDLTFHWDLRPGFESSGAAQFTLAGEKLFFTADDGFRGNELWTFDNQPPVAHAGADQVVQPGATVTLSGGESTDPDDPNFPLLSFEWRDFDGRVRSRFVNVELPSFQPGATEFTLIARDGLGGRNEDTVQVSTPGRTAPVVTIVAPENGEPLVVGTPVEIQWTVEDPESIMESRVLLSTDNGTSYVPVCTGGPGATGSCTWTPPTYLEHARLRVEVQDEHGDRGAQMVTIDVMGQRSGPQRLAVTVTGLDGSMALVFSDQGQYCFAEIGQTEATCLFFYEPGTQVTFQPMFGPPNVFVGWSGDCTGTESCTVTMNGWRRVTATFRPPQHFDMTVVVDSVDNGLGFVGLSGSDGSFNFCEGTPGTSQTCTFQYLEGTVVDVMPTPAPGTTFLGWAGDCTGEGPCAVTMDQARQVAATFRGTPTFDLTVTIDGVDAGFASIFLSGSDGSFNFCDAMGEDRTCTFPYPEGTQVQLSANWNTDELTFLGWAGDCTGDGLCDVVMDQARQVAATFQLLPYANLHVNVDSTQFGLGRVDVIASDGTTNTCQGVADHLQFCTFQYPRGTTVTLQAFAGADSVFLGWFGGECAGTGSCPLTLNFSRFAGSASFRGPQTLGVRVLTVNGGSGRVQLSGGLGFCENNGNNTFCPFNVAPGTTVSFTAQPRPHAVFVSWGGACSGTGPCQVTTAVTPAVTVTAAFRFVNGAPVANAGGPYTGVRNQPITFNGSGSSDPDGDPLTYSWDFGDGTTGTGVAPTHAYSNVGTFTARLRVSDGFINSFQVTTSVTVNNAPPVANAGGPYTGVRNQAIAFDGSGSSDPDGHPLTHAWDFGDGSVGSGVAPLHAYSTLGTFTVTLTVSNGQATSAPATTTVTIHNLPPVANPGGPYTGVRNQAIAFNGSGSSDPDGDPLTYAWDFGDGTQGSGVAPTHAYSTLGTFTVTLAVSDGNTSSAPATTTVTINNIPPVANPGGPYTGVRNQAIAFNGSGSSDPDGDPLTYVWDFGDGTVGSGVAPTHAFATLGTFTVTLTVSDGHATSAPATTSVTIVNLPPQANAGPDRTVRRHAIVLLDGRASADPDGTIAAYAWRQVSGPPVFLLGDRFPVAAFQAPNVHDPVVLEFELTVTDNDGATASDRVRITVTRH
jgi:ELWxxDGT repeat protein